MVTQKGVMGLRGNSWLMAVLVGMFVGLATSGAFALQAQAEEVGVDDEVVQTSERGFNRDSVYRVHAKRVLTYRTDTSVEELRFVVDSDEANPIAAEDTPAGNTTLWHLASNPEAGATLVAQTKSADDDTWTNLDTVNLKDAPILKVDTLGVRGGATLDVRGTVANVADDIATNVRLELYREDGTSTQRGKDVVARGSDVDLATLSIAELQNGNYVVRLVASVEDREVARSEQSVKLYRTKPSVAQMGVTPSPVYAGSSFTVTGRLATTAGIDGVTLRYGEQSVALKIAPDGSFTHTFQGGFVAGEYQFYVLVDDLYGNTNRDTLELQGYLELTVLPVVTTNPVVPEPSLLLQPIEKDTTRRLSTNFSTPLAANRTIGSAQAARTATGDDDLQAVLGSETEALERMIDLGDGASTSKPPVEATPRGWMIFGAPWYWWMTGGVAAIGTSVYAYRWVVRRA